MTLKHKLVTITLSVIVIFTVSTYAQTLKPQPAAYNQMLQSSSLLFMENKGQVADAKGNLRPDILFTANSAGAKLYVSANAIHYQFTKTEYPKGYDPHKREPVNDVAKEAELQKQIKTSTHRFSLQLQGANLHPAVITEKQSAYTENYYLAHCPDGITSVHGYEKITYKNVYPKIDWVIYSTGGFMEYDFLVHPGGNPSNIKLKVKDAESVSITADGELLMKTSLGEVREKAPVSYADGAVVESHFKQLGDGAIGFDVQPQPGKELRIDPSVVWATYYGGAEFVEGYGCTVDPTGNAYLAGFTNMTSGIASGGFQNSYGGNNNFDAFLAKFDNFGNRIWATYYGGTGSDYGHSCVTDSLGNVYLAGTTNSTGMASSGFQNIIGGREDALIIKFSSAGNRIWASYCGGANYEEGYSCAIDNLGNVYLAGWTSSYTGFAFNGFQNTSSGYYDAFLAKFNPTGNRIWGTYYGGADDDFGRSCIVDKDNNVYMAGNTSSSGIAAGSFQDTIGGYVDAFLVKFNSAGGRIWATYYGGSDYDDGSGCAVDSIGNVYLAGTTQSSTGIGFGGFKDTIGGIYDAYLIKFNSTGNRLWGTYYGGNSFDYGRSCAVDANGNVYLAGYAGSDDGIALGGFNDSLRGSGDAFVAKFKATGKIIWGTYYGGNGYEGVEHCTVGRNGYLYITGQTNSTSGIASNGFQNNFNGVQYASFLGKLNGSGGDTSTISICPNGSFFLTSNFTGTIYQWQINTGSGFVNLSNNSNYSGTSTMTLQLSNLPSNFYGYQYRCVVNGNPGDVVEVRFANTWAGTTTTAWENPANWSCGILPDGNTDIIINTGSVTLNSNGICRTLTVKPGASFTVAAGYTLTITH